MANLNDILNNLIKTRINEFKIYSEIATVISVDENNMKCDVSFISSNADKTVRLGASISEDGTALTNSSVLLLPTVNSKVLVTFINETTGFVSSLSAISKILIKIGSRYLQIQSDFIEIGGNTDFLVRFSVLKTAYDQLKSDHDNTVAKLNAVINLLKTWTVVPNDGGAALKAAAASLTAASNSTGNISGAKIEEIKTI